jgi:hypothetical protein
LKNGRTREREEREREKVTRDTDKKNKMYNKNGKGDFRNAELEVFKGELCNLFIIQLTFSLISIYVLK